MDQSTSSVERIPMQDHHDTYNYMLDQLVSARNDTIKVEVITDQYSIFTSDEDSQSVEWGMKTREVSVSDMESVYEDDGDGPNNFSVEDFRCEDSDSSYCPTVESRCCSSCFKTFLNKEALAKHVATRCSQQFLPTEKNSENQSKARPKLNKCSVLDKAPPQNKAVQSRRDLKQRSVLPTLKDLTCDVCNKSFTNQRSINQHSRTHRAKKHICPVCKKAFQWARCLRHHAGTHSKVKTFECKQCPEKFTTSGRLKWHLTHHIDEAVQCEVCEKSFRNKAAIRKHMAVHEAVKKYACDLCGVRFRTGLTKRMHVESVHGSRVKKFECAECGKKYVLLDYLRRHIATHSQDKKYVCHVCDKQFTTSKSRNRHVLTHAGLEGVCVQCKICNKTFLHATYLRRHLNAVHPAGKRYECAECKKQFAAPQYLKQHLLVHSGVKDFQCDVCHKLFNNRSNRNKHVLMHDKPRKRGSTVGEILLSDTFE